MSKNLFDLIAAEKQDIPKMDKTIREAKKTKLNLYQKVSIITMILCFVAGIIMGNLFPSCVSGDLYSKVCVNTEYNISLALLCWFVSFIFCLMIFAVGHIINLLEKINKNLEK